MAAWVRTHLLHICTLRALRGDRERKVNKYAYNIIRFTCLKVLFDIWTLIRLSLRRGVGHIGGDSELPTISRAKDSTPTY
jgi:hypothetical protein